MQLYAEDGQGELVAAYAAKRHYSYRCRECGHPVRLRQGDLFRRPHFFHLKASFCSQSGKGAVHLCIQQKLQQQLPDGEIGLEVAFRSINRIADVVWHSKRLVFEIQCAPIRPEELLARINDYQSIGYRVIWILHRSRYGHLRLSAAELALISYPHYFTDLTAEGIGYFYDSCCVIANAKVWRTPFIPIQPLQLLDIKELPAVKLPSQLAKRRESWPSCCSGDWLDLFCNRATEQTVQKVKREWPSLDEGWQQSLFQLWSRGVERPYRLLLQLLLEQSCQRH